MSAHFWKKENKLSIVGGAGKSALDARVTRVARGGSWATAPPLASRPILLLFLPACACIRSQTLTHAHIQTEPGEQRAQEQEVGSSTAAEPT